MSRRVRATATVVAVLCAALTTTGLSLSAHAVEPAKDVAASTLTWTPCAAGQCAWLPVPRDYADTSAGTIRIRVSRVKSTNPAGAPGGSLVVNPGGPGAAGLSFASYVAQTLPASVARTYDIIGFDPRGVGESAPITCMSGRQTTRWLRTDSTPDTARERSLLMKRAAAIAEGCLSRSPNMARHVSTDDTARDLDLLRQALGEPSLNLLGYSYGTYLGTRYAALFGERVGRFVLDGAIDPTLDIMEISRGQSTGFQLALERFAADCARRESCPWRGSTRAVLAGIEQLLVDLDRAPLPVRDDRPLVQSQGITAVVYAMYSPSLWSSLRRGLAEGLRGDGFGLAALSDAASDRIGPNRYISNIASAFPAIACWDAPPAPGEAGLADAAQAWSQGVGVPEIARALAWSNAPCSSWYGHSPIPPGPATSSTKSPVLVIGGAFDAATPLPWARALASQLPTATLLTYRGDGHTSLGAGSACVDQAVASYLVDGVVPLPGTVCF